MSWLHQRQDVLSQNVANVDTPGFTARDLKPVDFNDTMRSTGTVRGNSLAVTDPRHIAIRPTSVSKFDDFETRDIESNPQRQFGFAGSGDDQGLRYPGAISGRGQSLRQGDEHDEDRDWATLGIPAQAEHWIKEIIDGLFNFHGRRRVRHARSIRTHEGHFGKYRQCRFHLAGSGRRSLSPQGPDRDVEVRPRTGRQPGRQPARPSRTKANFAANTIPAIPTPTSKAMSSCPMSIR